MQHRGDYVDESEHLFVYSDRSSVQPEAFRKLIRKLLFAVGLDGALYDTHSLHIGRSSDLIKYGYSVDEVKRMGRWRSSCVYKYIRC